MTSPKVEYPKPSQQEQELQQEQVNILRQQRDLIQNQAREQALLAPILYESVGIRPVRDASGQVVSYEKIPDAAKTEQETLRESIETQLLQRSQAALKGELPVDPALERELGDQETLLREQLRGQLGAGYETSSPGIETLGDFTTRAAELRQAARTGQLTLAEGLRLAGEETAGRAQQAYLNNLGQISSAVLPSAQLLGNVVGGYGQTLGSFARERGNKFQARLFNVQQPTPLETAYGLAYDAAAIAASFYGGKPPASSVAGGGGGGYGGGNTLGTSVYFQ